MPVWSASAVSAAPSSVDPDGTSAPGQRPDASGQAHQQRVRPALAHARHHHLDPDVLHVRNTITQPLGRPQPASPPCVGGPAGEPGERCRRPTRADARAPPRPDRRPSRPAAGARRSRRRATPGGPPRRGPPRPSAPTATRGVDGAGRVLLRPEVRSAAGAAAPSRRCGRCSPAPRRCRCRAAGGPGRGPRRRSARPPRRRPSRPRWPSRPRRCGAARGPGVSMIVSASVLRRGRSGGRRPTAVMRASAACGRGPRRGSTAGRRPPRSRPAGGRVRPGGARRGEWIDDRRAREGGAPGSRVAPQ